MQSRHFRGDTPRVLPLVGLPAVIWHLHRDETGAISFGADFPMAGLNNGMHLQEMLFAFLQQNRSVLIWKTKGLADDVARQSPFASDLSMIGVLAHLALVETSWFREIFAGHAIDYLSDFGYDFDDDIDAEWHLQGTETLAEARAVYTAAVEGANAVIKTADLETMSVQERGGDHFSLRWTMIHMIEETARHAGHLDVLREHLDQTIGYLPE